MTSLQSAVADAGFTKRGGGRTPSPEGASHVGLCGRGGANSGGGRPRCKHWPPGAGDPRYTTGRRPTSLTQSPSLPTSLPLSLSPPLSRTPLHSHTNVYTHMYTYRHTDIHNIVYTYTYTQIICYFRKPNQSCVTITH